MDAVESGGAHLYKRYRIYDLPLFVPLWIEARIAAASHSANAHAVQPTVEEQSLQEVQP